MRVFKWLGYLLIGLILLLAVLWLLLDPIAKWIIEREGTRAVGAKVELDSVDIRLLPLGVELSGLQVTNPQEPMRNALQTQTIKADLAWSPLLSGKVHVEEAAVEGLRINAPRANSGAVPGLTPPGVEGPTLTERIKEGARLPSLEIPKPDELLAKLDLETVRQAEAIEARIAEKQAAWEARLADLPDQVTIDQYKARIQALKDDKSLSGRLKAVSEITQIQKEIKQDLARFDGLDEALKADLAALQADLKKLESAPQKDMQRALALAGLDQNAVEGLARALLGDEVGGWIQQAYQWYALAEPYLGGGTQTKSEPVAPEAATRCDVSDGLPCFLVKVARIDGELPVGGQAIAFSGRAENLTDRADVLGLPANLLLSGGQNGGAEVKLTGALNRVVPSNPKDTLKLDMKDFPIQDLMLSQDEDFPVTLAKAIAEVAGQAVIENGQLDMDLNASFLNTAFEGLKAAEGDRLNRALAGALENMGRFDLQLLAEGALADPQLTLRSSLDKVLSGALKGILGEQEAQLRSQLGEQLDGVLGDKMPGLQSQYGELLGLDKLLGDRAGEFRGLL